MPQSYQWLTFGSAKQELALRLGDELMVRWTDAELGAWLIEALRVWNCLTAYWVTPYTFTYSPSGNWQAANGAGSPRMQTLTDTDVYTLIEYHLLEPPTGAAWTGTDQYSITDLQQGCSRRRNEILQAAACNMVEQTISLTPDTTIAQITDLAIDVRRCRWVPATGQGAPVTLQRGDMRSFQYFSPAFAQTRRRPLRWDVIGSPPEQITLDTQVPVPSTLQVLEIQGGPDFTPPTALPLLIPDDWMWVLKFGAMADILSKEQEGKDIQRAEYCRKRYVEGLKLMVEMPWLLQGFVNGVVVDTQALAGADRFNYEWQSRSTAFPEIVIAGIDLFALSPTPTGDMSVSLTLVGNAPIPADDAAFIEVARDVMDAILDESQHLALFSMGGQEFMASVELHKSFVLAAARQNARLRESGILPLMLRPPVSRQDEQQPRYALEGKQHGTATL